PAAGLRRLAKLKGIRGSDADPSCKRFLIAITKASRRSGDHAFDPAKARRGGVMGTGLSARFASATRRHGILRLAPPFALILAVSAAGILQARAQASSGKDNGNQHGAGIAEVPGEDIFGFTSATDVGDKGDLGFA